MSRSKPCDVPAKPVVAAVIPAFNPDEGLATLITQVAPQVAEVVVVDDGSISGLAVLDGLTGIRLVRQANAGVADALNAGVQLALADLGADAVLTLDQDSGIPADYVARAVAAWQSATAAGIPVALVCAKSYSGRPTPTRGRVDGFAQAFDPMQSGSLVPASTYRDVGFYDEALVVDAVDSEFTVRCLEAGLAPIVGPGCDLEHGQGDRRPVRLLGRDWGYNRHSPERVYYMARNGTVLTRRHLRHEPGWVLRRLTEEGKAHVLRLTFSPDRAQVAAAAMAGLRDGLRGRTGRRP